MTLHTGISQFNTTASIDQEGGAFMEQTQQFRTLILENGCLPKKQRMQKSKYAKWETDTVTINGETITVTFPTVLE
ncbi:hypothetical protein HY947_01615 [Candidatus Gottesmanbacteria bacterium]|nr:hypothetical protein [Candidatus Gottesmanbacteria bacterium]